jgi:predicted transcriptional regulator
MSPFGDMKPSPSEFVILKHLWAHGAQSQGEIHKGVESELKWSRSSTRKTVDRMRDKNMLRVKDVHGIRVYAPQLKKIPTIAEMVRHFTQHVLGFTGPLPVSQLMKSDVLSDEELQELEHYLAKTLEKKNGAQKTRDKT